MRSTTPSRTTAIPDWAEKCGDLLHERFREPLTLAEIAASVGVHPVHLSRSFRRLHGCTVGEFLRGLRIRWAANALQRPRVLLADIALQAGFCDQSHFARTFRRYMGMTPGEYRRKVPAG